MGALYTNQREAHGAYTQRRFKNELVSSLSRFHVIVCLSLDSFISSGVCAPNLGVLRLPVFVCVYVRLPVCVVDVQHPQIRTKWFHAIN